jgi:hypothetical protein
VDEATLDKKIALESNIKAQASLDAEHEFELAKRQKQNEYYQSILQHTVENRRLKQIRKEA